MLAESGTPGRMEKRDSQRGKMKRAFVKDLEDKQQVHSPFLVCDKSILVGKTGKPFMSVELGDRTGRVEARIWDRVDELQETFETGDYVFVKGHVQIFQGRKQLIIHTIERATGEQIDIREFLPCSVQEPEKMYEELLQMVHQIRDEHILRLTLETLHDPEIKRRLLLWPAAKSIHHAFISGLLEHTVSLCKLVLAIAKQYSLLNQDHLIFGAIFHDLGKIWELTIDNGIRYTDSGRMVGHLVLCSEYIEKKSSQMLGFPGELKDLCKHMVLSHHGKYEYGSPKRPKTLEALVVSMADDLDSKLNTLTQFFEQEMKNGDKWSRYNNLFDRYFYLGAPIDRGERDQEE